MAGQTRAFDSDQPNLRGGRGIRRPLNNICFVWADLWEDKMRNTLPAVVCVRAFCVSCTCCGLVFAMARKASVAADGESSELSASPLRAKVPTGKRNLYPPRPPDARFRGTSKGGNPKGGAAADFASRVVKVSGQTSTPAP